MIEIGLMNLLTRIVLQLVGIGDFSSKISLNAGAALPEGVQFEAGSLVMFCGVFTIKTRATLGVQIWRYTFGNSYPEQDLKYCCPSLNISYVIRLW